MQFGVEAVTDLVDRYPNSHVFFGQHQSGANFAAALSRPGWMVLEKDSCWLMLEDHGVGDWELHWFCPVGSHMPSLRAMLKSFFDTVSTARTVFGTNPPKHPYRREARVLARALGAAREGDRLVLSRDRFLTYNAGKPGM